ncbi:MAG: hypothetical protein ABI690_20670 [Chloroflexota bacterium]
MLGRDGNISVIRVGTLAAIIGVLFIVGAIAFFFIDRASHQVPLEIDPFPGASVGGKVPHSKTSQTEYFQIPNTSAEDVVAYYQDKMDSFYGSGTEKELRECKRFPAAGEQLEYQQGKPGITPYQYTCLFDRSGFFVSQTTTVIIQPGIDKNKGTTIVAHDQTWES